MRKEEITREQYRAMARIHAAHRVNKELDEQDCPYLDIEDPDEELLEECGVVCTNPWGCHTFRHLRGDGSVEKEQPRLMRLCENTRQQCEHCMLRLLCKAVLEHDKRGFTEEKHSQIAALSCPVGFIVQEGRLLGCYQEGDMVSAKRLSEKGLLR